ncbi:MAG: alpha/beta fold hydrolase [Armatimonadetes bacterium]|nr:alpha/beta fold hydrolase [Armatimonadota bacterium]MDE2207854.1 alpha/beta fold hydrolase [Armatimonadota bacterium]
MNRLKLIAFAAAMLAAPASAVCQSAPPPATAIQAMRLSLYAYDASLPLNATLKPMDATATHTRYLLSYDSVHDQRVPAILSLPVGFVAPWPAVILLHGSGGNKDSSYIQWAAEMLNREGYAALSIDTQYCGDRRKPGVSGNVYMPDSYRMRDAWVQTVVDLRRAVDYLDSRSDIAPKHIGFLGFSQGAMLGAVFGGVDRRVSCVCLAVPGGGFVNVVKHIDRYPLLKSYWPEKATPSVMRKVEMIAGVTDPIHYIGRIAPRPLMMIVANQDQVIPPESSAALVAAADSHGHADVERWQSGHILNPNALFDIRAFFEKQFGKAAPARRAD